MTIFELVKLALDELYAEGKADYGSSLDDKIRDRLKYLSQNYGDLKNSDRKPVDYKDSATRFAYAFKYVTAHGDYIVQILQELRNTIGPIFKGDNLRLSCIGGGPGSDIIAVLKYLDEYKKKEPVKKVTCYLLDREPAWADTWTELDDSLNIGIELNANFQPLDVTKSESWKAQKKFLQADLFTMSYFVSEVFALDKDGVVSAFWKTLFESAKPGALFLYDDNGHTIFTEYFDNLWKAQKFECITKGDNQRFVPRFSEESSELADYKKKFDQSPKLQSQVTYRVLRKP